MQIPTIKKCWFWLFHTPLESGKLVNVWECPNIFTARKQSLRRLCFHRCLPVHGSMYGRGGMCSRGGHAWKGSCMAGGQVWRGGGMHGTHIPRQILRDTVNERVVRILLECILVEPCFFFWGGLCLGVDLCQGDPPYGKERAVCILLEWILVLVCECSFSYYTQRWSGLSNPTRRNKIRLNCLHSQGGDAKSWLSHPLPPKSHLLKLSHLIFITISWYGSR